MSLLSELRLYLANHFVNRLPSHTLRTLYYSSIMGFTIGKGSSIHLDCTFDCAGGLSIGENSTINAGCSLDTRGTIKIGNNVALTSGVWISTVKHDLESIDFSATAAAVHIHDYAFIGRRAIVLQGCVIGKGAVLGAAAVLTKSIPDFEVWAGNPARKIGERRRREFKYDCRYRRLFF